MDLGLPVLAPQTANFDPCCPVCEFEVRVVVVRVVARVMLRRVVVVRVVVRVVAREGGGAVAAPFHFVLHQVSSTAKVTTINRMAAAYPGGCDCDYVLPLNGRATCEVEE